MLFDAPHPFLVSRSTPRRRNFAARPAHFRSLHCVGAALLILWGSAAGAEEAGPSYLLKAASPTARLTSTRSILNVDGHLKLNPSGKEVNRLPLQVAAKLNYDERVLAAGTAEKRTSRTARYYHTAEANIVVGSAPTKTALREERQLIVCEPTATGATLFSPLGNLQREELDLLEIPGNSALVDALIPGREVRKGDTWTHDNPVLCGLLNIEAISLNEVESKLADVTDGTAKVDMLGRVSGAVGGVASELEIAARYGINVAAGRVVWLAMTVKENRSIGHATPGLEVTAQLQLVIDPQTESKYLADAALAGLPLVSALGMTLLDFRSLPGSYEMLHDRRWQVLNDRPELTVLRLVDQGELLAQCNISPLPDIAAEKRMSLDEFQTKIQTALGKSFGRIVDASEHASSEGLSVLRVVAAGMVNDLPIQWAYYLVTDSHGRRSTMVFTLEMKQAERFGGADQALVHNFRFTERPQPMEAEPQPAASAGPAAGSQQSNTASTGTSPKR